MNDSVRPGAVVLVDTNDRRVPFVVDGADRNMRSLRVRVDQPQSTDLVKVPARI